jgi:two-component system sensor histidine kinase AlgZ
MQDAFGTRRSAALYLLAWLMLGLLLAALVRAAGAAGWSASLLFALPLALVYAFATGFSTYFLCRARPLAGNSAWSALVVVGFAAVCTSSLWTGAGIAWNGVWRALAPGEGGIELGASLAATLFGLGVILYCLTAVAHYLAIELDRARQLETRELQTKLMAQDAELRMLRTQVDPHFLFNSLNSISALTSIDAAAARDMTLQLSEFFRHSLGLEAHRKVTLEAELKLVRHFLAIEQVRFGPRLVFAQDIADDVLACLLPPMILQPLVENAVKHGIGGLLSGGRVEVVAARAGSILRISVANDVDHEQPAAPGNGIGLANVRQRLAAAYAHEASVNWARSAGAFRVDLALPAETMEA